MFFDPHAGQRGPAGSSTTGSPGPTSPATRSMVISTATECLQAAPFLPRWYGQSQTMPPSVTATICQDPGEDSLATSHLPMLRTVPSAPAIRIGRFGGVISWIYARRGQPHSREVSGDPLLTKTAGAGLPSGRRPGGAPHCSADPAGHGVWRRLPGHGIDNGHRR